MPQRASCEVTACCWGHRPACIYRETGQGGRVATSGGMRRCADGQASQQMHKAATRNDLQNLSACVQAEWDRQTRRGVSNRPQHGDRCAPRSLAQRTTAHALPLPASPGCLACLPPTHLHGCPHVQPLFCSLALHLLAVACSRSQGGAQEHCLAGGQPGMRQVANQTNPHVPLLALQVRGLHSAQKVGAGRGHNIGSPTVQDLRRFGVAAAGR